MGRQWGKRRMTQAACAAEHSDGVVLVDIGPPMVTRSAFEQALRDAVAFAGAHNYFADVNREPVQLLADATPEPTDSALWSGYYEWQADQVFGRRYG